jgi:TRAP-type mannitol/chloroaromatic compound transport system substrate-binding protein
MNKLWISILVLAALVWTSAGCAPAEQAQEQVPSAPAEQEQEQQQAPSAPAEKVYTFTWQDNSGPGVTMLLTLEDMAARIKADSGGAIDIKVVPEGTIVPRAESTPAVKDGVLDIATNDTSMDLGKLGPIVYLTGPAGVPAGPSTLDIVGWIYKGGGMDLVADIYKDYGYVVGVQPGAPELFAHSNKPLSTKADFKGLKFRTAGMWSELLTSYGAAVVMINAGELYSSVERGVLDAFELGPPSFNWPYGFHEVCDYIGLPGIHSPGYAKPVLFNKAAWDSLPPILQDLFKSEVLGMCMDTYMALKVTDAEALANYAAYGTKTFYVDDAFQAEIAADSRALIAKLAQEDPAFAALWEQEQAFYKVWRGADTLVPKYTIFD